jgi:chemotaxis-related protein WspD
VSLLARDPPADYISEWTEHFARQNQIGESNTHSVLIFRLGSECYSLPTAVCDEVAELRKIHTLPNRRSTAVLGLVNVRGELIICVSIRRMLGVGEPRLQQPQRDGTATERLVVFRDKDGRIAFPVDEVLTSHRYHPLELKPGPATVAKAAAAFTRGVLSWGDRLIGHLDHQIIIEMAKRSIT